MKTSREILLPGSARPLLWALVAAIAITLPWPASAKEQLSVEINGVSAELLENVRASLAIVRQRNNESLGPQLIRELYARAENEIYSALEPFGYYRAQIITQLTQPVSGTGDWQARFNIDPGPRVPIAGLDIQLTGPGASDSNLQALSSDSSLRSQKYLDHRVYESAKQTLLKALKEHGYLDAHYAQHVVEVDLASYVANITLHIDTGPRYVIGSIELDQQRFAPDYLARYIILQPGEVFSQARISQQRTLLGRSGYFQDVAIELGEPSEEDPTAIPLSVQLVPYKANRYRGRVGWGTDTGPGVQLDWTRRYLGRRGHHFNLGVTAVEDRKRLAGDISYLIPLNPLNGNKIELGLRHESKDLSFEDVDLDEGGETRIATNLASAWWHVPDRKLWGFEVRGRAGLSLVGESYDVFEVLFGNLSNDAQKALIERLGPEAYATLAPDFEAVVPGVSFTFKRSDDPLYIRRGDYFKLELLGADDSLGSNTSFWQARLNSWNIWSLGEGNRLLLRTSAGYTAVDSKQSLGVNFNQIPEYYEFRAGGARSVRGYGFETLFPSDAITGGKHQLVASVEYEREIIPNWSVAVFLDGGNAFNDFDNIDEKLGAGLGIRWRSPVGLARIDLGVPLDEADDSFQVYITIGPEF